MHAWLAIDHRTCDSTKYKNQSGKLLVVEDLAEDVPHVVDKLSHYLLLCVSINTRPNITIIKRKEALFSLNPLNGYFFLFVIVA